MHVDTPDEVVSARRSLLERLEDRTDGDVLALTADRLAQDLECLLDALVDEVAQHQVAASDWRAAQRLRRYAHKHEDAALIYWTHREVEHGERVVPRSAAQCTRYWQQWRRHWAALLKHRLPDALYDALEAIAAAEHRTLHEQILLVLRAGVARWQVQHPPS